MEIEVNLGDGTKRGDEEALRGGREMEMEMEGEGEIQNKPGSASVQIWKTKRRNTASWRAAELSRHSH